MFCVSPDTNPRYRDRCASRPPESITDTATLNYVRDGANPARMDTCK